MRHVIIIAIAFVLLIPIPVFAEISITSDGGDCSKIGNWNANSKTCTLNMDVNETIFINGNYVTIDGNNHKIVGNNDNSETVQTRSCISVDAKLGIIIKNFEIKNCGFGISFQDVIDSTIEGNTISENIASGIYSLLSDNNIIKNNNITNNPNGGIAMNGNNNLIENNLVTNNSHLYLESDLQGVGISLNLKNSVDNIFRSNTIEGHKTGINFDGIMLENTIEDNIITNNEIGIKMASSESTHIISNKINQGNTGIQSQSYAGIGGKLVIRDNEISNNAEGLWILSEKNNILENTISSNNVGLILSYVNNNMVTKDNKIYKNNFIGNDRQVTGGNGNYFNVNNQGNYWDDFSSNCVDSNSDKICDEPYPFSSGSVGVVDTAVWVEKDGWLTVKNQLESITPKQTISEPESESGKLGIASFVDRNKDPQSYIDRYNNEPSYEKWFDDNYPEYDSIEQAVGLELTQKIPSWVKNIFLWYGQDQVSEDELLNAIKYLIDKGILVVN